MGFIVRFYYSLNISKAIFIFKKIKSEFTKNVLTLVTGTSIAQLIPILLTPILTRLFTTEEMGYYALYLSIVTLLTVLSTGRYEIAILLPKKDKDAISLGNLALIIVTLFSVLLFILILIFNRSFIEFLGVKSFKYIVYFIPLFVLLGGYFNVFTLWMHRKKQFNKTSYSKITLNFTEYIINMFIGLKKNGIAILNITSVFKKAKILDVGGNGFKGLLIGKFMSQLVATFYLGRLVVKKENIKLFSTSKSDLKLAAKEYSEFPKINLPHVLSDELKTSGLSFVIKFFFTASVLGLYSQTYKILRAPLAIIGTSFGHVFFQKAAEMHAQGNSLTHFIQKTVYKLFLIALPIFILIYILSPWFFSVFLGKDWAEAGIYAQYITPWLFVNFIISPVSQVAVIVGKQFQFWMVSLVGNLLVFFAIVISGLVFKDIKIGFIIISCTQVVFYVCVYFWLIRISRVATKK